ncbi:hypothetical protein D6833_10920 [Candidatus Parcubacteria bacterium]|nr:MAG: hypothetical protein D6833_10920 [Candidatus Parcubacteria bacterium]
MNKQQQIARADRRERAKIVMKAAKLLAAEVEAAVKAYPDHAEGLRASAKVLREASRLPLRAAARKENLKTLRRELSRFIPAISLLRGDSDFEGELVLEVVEIPASPRAMPGIVAMLERGRMRAPGQQTAMGKALAKAMAKV